MSAARRLRRGREFDRVYREGRSTRGALLVVRAAPGSWPVSRWGFVTSKKVARRAVDRNRLRRRLREAARMDHAVAGAADRIVSVTRNGANATFRQLRAELRNVISRQDAAR